MDKVKKMPSNRQVALTVVWSLVLVASLVCASNGHLRPHNQLQQGHTHETGHNHANNGQLSQGLNQQQQQQTQNQMLAAPQHTSEQGSGAGKIMVPLATGALMGAAMQKSSAQGQLQRHFEEEREKILIDLSHPLHNKTLHWPKFNDFQYTTLIDGERNSSKGETYYLKADAISTAIHLGTHLDAPLHFSKTGWPVDKIPLNRLIDVPVNVIDLSAKVAANRSYTFASNDFLDSKTNNSLVRPKSVVLVYTGLSELYEQGESAYLGTSTRNISEMRIPGFSGEAADYLIKMGVYGVGLDSPSADSSNQHEVDESMDPVAHVKFNENNIYILENVSGKLKELVNAPAARLTIAPLPIVDGSGSPVRLVAIVGHDECHCHAHNSASQDRRPQHSSLSIFITLFLCSIVFLM